MEILKATAVDTVEGSSPADTGLTMACLLAFAGFFIYDEMPNICPCDIKFAEHVSIPASQKQDRSTASR